MPTAFRGTATRTPIIGRSSHASGLLAALPTRASRRIDVFPTIIVPFFAIYLAWQMFREDWLAFESRAEVSAATGLTAAQQRDVLNRARELLRENLGRAYERGKGES